MKRVVYAWPQAADVPLDDVEEVEDDADEAAGFASGFAGDEPVDEPVDESDVLAVDDVAGALLDEEPRLSFR